MLAHQIKIRYRTAFLTLGAIVSVLIFQTKLYAQGNLVTGPMTGTIAAGIYYNPTSIVISPNAVLSGSGGGIVLHIAQADCTPLGNNFSTNQNYILTTVPHTATYSPTSTGLGTCDVMQTVQYLDGLGRPIQTVQVKGSTNGNDVVQPIVYDQYGRESTKYLPYANNPAVTSDGSFKTDALTQQTNFYAPGSWSSNTINTPSPFAVTNFEQSPLDRPIEQGAAGADWQPVAGNTTGHTVKINYLSNDGTIPTAANSLTGYGAILYSVSIDGSGNYTLVNSGNYNPAQLYVTVTTDENWTSGRLHTTEEYKDKLGHVVLKRTFNYNTATGQNEILSTYYVYDDLNNLAFVLPPGAGGDNALTSAANQTTINNFCYQYKYDQRNRLTEKYIPGKGWTFMVYNTLDQVIFTQDAFQRSMGNQVWEYIKYDAQGRQVMTGLWTSSAYAGDSNATSPSEDCHNWLINWANLYNPLWITRDNTQQYGYSVSDPQGPIVTINYYDDYAFPGASTYPNSTNLGITTNATGLLTGTMVTAMSTIFNTNPDRLMTVNYYDGLGRNVQTFKQHYLNSKLDPNNYDAIVTGYNFNDQPTSVTRQHHNTTNTSGPVLTVANTYDYDHMGRKIRTWVATTTSATLPQPVLLSDIEYNEIGQVMTKHLHSTNSTQAIGSTPAVVGSFLQDIGYTYNERGWLTQSSSGLFQELLQYNNNVIGSISPTPQYNGNIASQTWGTAASPNTKSFTYSYDQLNRLTDGVSNEGYTENAISYDLMGNIQSLTRQGTTHTYSYINGGQLSTVSGITVAPYTYNLNGSVGYDGRLNKLVTYNLLGNLQSQASDGFNLNYNYDADGNKLNKTFNGASTDYINGIQYDYNGSTIPSITFIQTEEGRIIGPTTSPNFEYSLTDHLGNSRVTFDSSSGASSPKQADDYYPFGMEIVRSTTVPSPKNEYLYNKKELQEELGQYDYGARFYDPVIGRFTTIDPLAEKNRRFTSYAYGDDNPIRNIDFEGMETINAGDLPEHNGTTSFYREASFTVRHPFIAHSIGSSDPDSRSTNISSDAARFSINGGLTENKSHEGSERNAMRHVTWSATITSEYGKDIAKQVGDAHEENPGADLTQRTFTGANAMDQADQTVDLLNNIVGRQIGSDNEGASVKDIAIATLNEFHTNGLYTATVNKDGSITIGKTKLSDKEYKADLKKINSLDANGFKPKPPEKKKDGQN